MSEKAPQKRSDEETEAVPVKSVRPSGNQQVPIETSMFKRKKCRQTQKIEFVYNLRKSPRFSII
ncbi:hypothetical protein H131_13738 [Lysinibacillus sphaericus OT4b.31]|uniref:Uncharacterized protein n=1 Tax=Lysinibacillus sphaericus OT4b.31 TaxID=1285586 RepID=R7ZCZ8_LYSSH|nr:hypothetical protein H131_13738 [Lysinibacillus sphaericus OT4b.31]